MRLILTPHEAELAAQQLASMGSVTFWPEGIELVPQPNERKSP